MHRKSVLRAVAPESARHAIGGLEAFVLSQVGERSVVEDVAETAGLDVNDMLRLAQRLSEMGVIIVEDPSPKRRPSSKSLRAVKVATPAPLTDADHALIAELAARIEVTSHYEVLGVERDVEIKVIRRAYHELAARCHPDRFYGKDLGANRRTVERIFDRVTRAYETLSRKAERAEHDAMLGPPPVRAPATRSIPVRRSSRKMAAVGANAPAPEATEAPRASKRPARAEGPSRASKRPVRADAQPRPSKRPASRNEGAVRHSKRPHRAEEPARHSKRPDRTEGRGRPSKRPDPAGALFRFYDDARQKAALQRTAVFVSAAKEALDRGDVVNASAHYRLAAQCTEDPAVHAALAGTDERARRVTFDTSVERARAAEGAGRWGEAASKYARAYEARPEAWVAERAANAMRNEGKELKKAAQLAERAVLAEPHNAGYRVTLGEVFLDAGLLARAAGESGRASALAPDDRRVRELARLVAGAKRR